MHSEFYLPEDPDYTILDSAHDSVRFAHLCLEPGDCGRWYARASFVDIDGEPMHWHDFGDLEGPGWAANAVGAAYQLYAWGRFGHCGVLQHVGLGLLDHVFEAGFLEPNGFIRGYRDLTHNRFCLNFKHNSDWFCPGSMAHVALKMLWASDILPETDARAARLCECAARTADWLLRHLECPTDWYPRRATPEGKPYPHGAEGGDDPLADGSGDGVYIPWLLLELTERGLGDHGARVRQKAEVILERGGIYGSINHDTYDADENVARAETFRFLRRAGRYLSEPRFTAFALEGALAGLERFQMKEDRNGVKTKGLLYMEDSWDTCYLWENAEASLAYLEAHEDTGNPDYLCCAVTILRAIARHHYGQHGFLTEGIDWNNHVGAQHHVDGAPFAAIRYTEPLLNNLHHIEPTMRYLERHIG